MMPRVDQLLVSASPGDAIFNLAVFLRGILRRRGYVSDIFAQHIAPALPRGYAALASSYRPRSGDTLFFHYSTGTPLNAWARDLDVRIVLVYHNITPPSYFRGLNPRISAEVAQGRALLPMFRERASLALANSQFSRRELDAAGYTLTGVLPLPCLHNSNAPADPTVMHSLNDDRTKVLFVGRLLPHKKQDDLLLLLHSLRQLDNSARLVLVGSWGGSEGYLTLLKSLASAYGLAAHVCFAGHVSESALRAYYRSAQLFVSMSEHEGFGVPLIEALAHRVPVIAYDATAVPETLGQAGILVNVKRWDVLAALAQTILRDDVLRRRLIERGEARAEEFSPARVQGQFEAQLALIGL